MSDRPRIGELLTAAGFVSEEQLADALRSQKETGRRLGEELVALGLVAEVQLTQILSNQLSLPWVSLYHVEFSRELLNLLPAELAEQYRVIPVYKRTVHSVGETLFIAMDDPTDTEAIDAVRSRAGLPVKVMVAPPSEVRKAIQVYYFRRRPDRTSDRVVRHDSPKASPPEIPEEAKTGKIKKIDEETQSTKSTSNMVTLTLLDGTTVRLPAPQGEGATTSQKLTAMDLVAALVARGQGAEVSDILPEQPWETLMATLLSILLRKGLIADWEFVEEWEKHRAH